MAYFQFTPNLNYDRRYLAAQSTYRNTRASVTSFWDLYCYLWRYFTSCPTVFLVKFEQVITVTLNTMLKYGMKAWKRLCSLHLWQSYKLKFKLDWFFIILTDCYCILKFPLIDLVTVSSSVCPDVTTFHKVLVLLKLNTKNFFYQNIFSKSNVF